MITVAILRAAGLTEEQVQLVLDLERAEVKRARQEAGRERIRRFRERQRLPAVIEATQIPAAWHPNPEGVQRAAAYGCEGFVLEVEVDRFRNYYLARGRVMTDWDACWANWVASPFFMKGSANGTNSRADFLARWDATIKQLDAAALLGFRREADAAHDPGPGDQ